MIEPRSTASGQGAEARPRERAWFVLLDGFDLVRQRPRRAWLARLARAAIVVSILFIVSWVIVSARARAAPGLSWSVWVGGSALLVVPAMLFVVALFLPRVHLARLRGPWARLSTPEGVDAFIAEKRFSGDDALRERRRAVLRACSPLAGATRWHEVDRLARSFGVAPPVAVLVGARDRFPALRSAEIPVEMLEPEEIGRAVDADEARAILRDPSVWLFLLASVTLIVVIALPRPSGSVVSPWVIAVAAALVAAWRLFRAPTRGMPGGQRSLVAAPGLVVSRGGGPDRVFTRNDSVLVIHRNFRRVSGALATITRRDGEREALEFPSERDPRLVMLWRLWLHPRESRWDAARGEAIPREKGEPEKGLEIPG